MDRINRGILTRVSLSQEAYPEKVSQHEVVLGLRLYAYEPSAHLRAPFVVADVVYGRRYELQIQCIAGETNWWKYPCSIFVLFRCFLFFAGPFSSTIRFRPGSGNGGKQL